MKEEEGEKKADKKAFPRPYSYSDLGFGTWENAMNTTLDAGKCLGLDFGGTLSKIVFFEPTALPDYVTPLHKFLLRQDAYGSSGKRDSELSFSSERLGGRLHFIYFETSQTEGAVRLLKGFQHNIRRVSATGGGAFKFSSIIKEQLGIRLTKQDELQTVVRGITFTLLERPDQECFTLRPVDESEASNMSQDKLGISHVDALSYEMAKVPVPMPVGGDIFPLLVVNIGSGVSIINVTSPSSFKRVSGTAIGGATYYGLCKLLLRCKSFDEAMDLAQLGDSRNVNLTVQDIYGGSYEQVGLSGEITASFFGKCASAFGGVRTARSRKKAFVPFVEKLCLIVIALLCANLLKDSQLGDEDLSYLKLGRELVLLLMPLGMAYFVLLSSEAQLTSSQPPENPPPSSSSSSKPPKSSSRASRKPGNGVFEEADVARALVIMVAQNVTQIAFLNAKLYKSKRVLFTGNFLRSNQIALRALCSMIHIWSKGEIQALFMEHEGYFGAIGTFLNSCGLDSETRADAKDIPEETISDESSSDEDINVINDLLYKGEFPRRRSRASVKAFQPPRRRNTVKLGHKTVNLGQT